MKRRLLAALTILSCALASGTLLAGPAAAEELDPEAISELVAAQIDAVAPQVAVEQPSMMADGTAVVADEKGVLTIPSDVGEPITLESTNPAETDWSISLPELDGVESAAITEDGTVVFTSEDDVELAVQAVEDGVRILEVLESADAPDAYEFDLALPPGALLALHPITGGAMVIDASGETVQWIQAPWAVDSQGNSVPTWYEVDGSVLKQVIHHGGGHYAYPITADPLIKKTLLGFRLLFKKAETVTLAKYTTYPGLASAACAVAGPLVGAGCAAVIAGFWTSIDKTFNSAAQAGKCVEFKYLGIVLVGWSQQTCTVEYR
jgi:hypothetical protein